MKVIKNMDKSCLLYTSDLFEQKLVSKQFVLTIGYDRDNLQGQEYSGEVATDRYGRKIPKHAHGTINPVSYTHLDVYKRQVYARFKSVFEQS